MPSVCGAFVHYCPRLNVIGYVLQTFFHLVCGLAAHQLLLHFFEAAEAMAMLLWLPGRLSLLVDVWGGGIGKWLELAAPEEEAAFLYGRQTESEFVLAG